MPEASQIKQLPSGAESAALVEQAKNVPAAPPPAIPRRKHGWLWHAVCIICGLLFGFSVLVLGHKYLGMKVLPQPIIPNDYQFVSTPSQNFTDMLVAAIGKSQKEILVAAHQLTGLRVLEALRAAHQRGVVVKVLLDQEVSPKTLDWIQRANFSDVFLERGVSHNQFLVFDEEYVFVCNTPFVAEAPLKDASTGIFVRNKNLASQTRSYFFERLGRSQLSR